MRVLKYKKIDAFTSGTSLGNPAACIFLGENQVLTDEEMLQIAKEHKGFVSEVIYCTKISVEIYSLRYFSSECEVDFCGHGTIACMHNLISSDELLLSRDTATIHTKNTTLMVYNRIPDSNAVFIAAPEPNYISHSLTAEDIFCALGISSDKINTELPIEIINAGLNTLIVPIKHLEDEISIFPDEKTLKTFCITNNVDIVLIFSNETASNARIAHTRVFAPKFGYLEDPATGSGNSAFGYYMLSQGIWDGGDCAVEQGGNDRVFNNVQLKTIDGAVLFGGSSKVRINGDYYLE